ncbi:unnamed protein product [Rhizoctonia solani]|uniref:Protein kinase domain-containing protein n=1 Tax=Rhizoctonia solani TaxID=456999 RepID=A0A8H3DIP1_9AGAM|nr:unnamed protein product [Rhizoctonia solani]
MEDSAVNTNQLDWQDAVTRLAGYGCSNVTSKLSWTSDGDKMVFAGFYNIQMGTLAGYTGSVAVKYSNSQLRNLETLINEVRIVSRLQHLNVISFLGFVLTEPRQDEEQDGVKRLQSIGLVSPWVELNLRQWMQSKENIDRCRMAVQVAEAIMYLHDAGVIHGDLRSRSIMISNEGAVQITGFGASVLEQDTPDKEKIFHVVPRWTAAERFYKESTWPTKQSDVWSLGMVILELFSNEVPYSGASELRAISLIGNGRIPDQPSTFISIKPGFRQILWGMLLSCWQRDPKDRPSANVVRDILRVVNREGTTIDESIHLATERI